VQRAGTGKIDLEADSTTYHSIGKFNRKNTSSQILKVGSTRRSNYSFKYPARATFTSQE